MVLLINLQMLQLNNTDQLWNLWFHIFGTWELKCGICDPILTSKSFALYCWWFFYILSMLNVNIKAINFDYQSLSFLFLYFLVFFSIEVLLAQHMPASVISLDHCWFIHVTWLPSQHFSLYEAKSWISFPFWLFTYSFPIGRDWKLFNNSYK